MAKFTSAKQQSRSAGILSKPGPGKPVKDARALLIARKRGSMVDARDKLVQMARTGGDARDKIKKIRNLKEGKLDVKKTAKGGITIVTTTKGQLQLTTKKKDQAAAARAKKAAGAVPAGKAALRAAVAQAAASTKGGGTKKGNLTRKVGAGGALSISTKKKGTALKPGGAATVRGGRITKAARPARAGSASAASARPAGRAAARGSAGAARGVSQPAKLTRTIRGHMTEAARLDEELLSTHVDPVILKRTVKQNIRDPSPPSRRYVPTATIRDRDRDYERSRRDRSRSPMDMDYDRDSYRRSAPASRRSYNDYDDPRAAMEREDELYRRRIAKQNENYPEHTPRTMADRLDGNGASSSSFVSPLQGAKIVVSNLQETVSQDDITELFGDIGPLKRTKVVDPGSFEVVFVNRADALKAVEIYHNRQLDGKAMKCQVVGSGGVSASSSAASASFPKSSRSESSSLHPEMGAIHRALFSDRGNSSSNAGGRSSSQSRRGEPSSSSSRASKPLFTVTMPKKGDRR